MDVIEKEARDQLANTHRNYPSLSLILSPT
jgi:hypothetical protein